MFSSSMLVPAMSNDDLKKALFSRAPVEYGGITYQCVNGVIYRVRDGKIAISAELLDRSGRSVTIAPASKVEFAESGGGS